MGLIFIGPRGEVPVDETRYVRIDSVPASVVVLPTAGATVTVHSTISDRRIWENAEDDSDAIWEPVGDTYEFTEQQTIYFLGRVTGVRIASADEATTVDVLGVRG